MHSSQGVQNLFFLRGKVVIQFLLFLTKLLQKVQDMCTFNDPLGQTHSPDSSKYYSRLKVVLFCDILKSGDGRKHVRTDNTCENSDHYRPWQQVGLVDQFTYIFILLVRKSRYNKHTKKIFCFKRFLGVKWAVSFTWLFLEDCISC